MTAQIIPFPRPWPFEVTVQDVGSAYLVWRRIMVGCTAIAATQSKTPNTSPALLVWA